MKAIRFILVFITLSGALKAQQMVSGGVDSVVVGSTMPYAVTPDATIEALSTVMNPSLFRWIVTDNTDNELTAGATTFSVAETPTAGLYAEDSINVTWNIGANNVVKIKTTEVSQPKFGPSCDGNVTELEVHVLDIPSVGFNGTAPFQSGGCNLTTDTIDLDVSGIGPWIVTFSVEFDDNGSPVEFTETLGNSTMKGDFTLELILDNTTHFTNGAGKYDITLGNVTDRISRKSLSDVAGDVTNPGTEYTIGIYPTPNTGAIRHISN